MDLSDPAPPIAAYLFLGVEHLLFGIDHILFVIGLVLFIRDRWMLLKTITAFTLAHSITLALSVLDLVRLPQGPVEAVIALSILFLARELMLPGSGTFRAHADRAPGSWPSLSVCCTASASPVRWPTSACREGRAGAGAAAVQRRHRDWSVAGDRRDAGGSLACRESGRAAQADLADRRSQ